MTEAEWLACTDPQPMLEFLRGKATDRKLRLFAVACCRRVWQLLVDERSRNAVEISERYADGQASEDELTMALYEAGQALALFDERVSGLAVVQRRTAHDAAFAALGCTHPSVVLRPDHVAGSVAYSMGHSKGVDFLEDFKRWGDAVGAGASELLALVREVVGNPFRPVTFDATWLTPTVIGLAQTIYQERVFDSLPILSDALEDAGCGNADILNHCRQPGEHVRGCWVVDLLTGRK